MVEFVHETLRDLDEAGRKQLEEVVATVSYEAQLTYQRDEDAQAQANGVLERGQEAITSTFNCIDCHKFHDDGDLGTAPDLTGYGSLDWLVLMISNPEHERLYAAGNDRMPAFFADPDSPESNRLTREEVELLARWIRGDDVQIGAGE
jgi:ubiquinol-cytochrome c reductase cytochrome b subunit